MIDINEIFESFINPPPKESFFRKRKTKNEIHQDLEMRAEKMRYIKDLINSPIWRNVLKPKKMDALKSDFATLIRDGLSMSETDIKVVISRLRKEISEIADMRYAIEDGEKASVKLEAME